MSTTGIDEGFEIKSNAMKKVYKEIDKYAREGSNFILYGQSGVGKEYAARHYHKMFKKDSGVKDVKFVAYNCAGLTEGLAQSELFGHVKGAFTGALFDKEGLFEIAANGILFLDETGDLPATVQSKLLRAINGEHSEGIRVGGKKPYPTTNVKIICGTEQPEEILRKSLRNRLGFSVYIPRLSERTDDITTEVEYCEKKAILKRSYNGNIMKISIKDN